jgi:uncharacterized protein YerC
MNRISPQTEKRVIEMLLKGDTYEKIARATDTCKALVNRVYNDQKKRTPDFDQLRNHAKQLRKHDLSVFDEKRVHNLIERLNTAGISIEELEDYIALMEQIQTERELDSDIICVAIQIKQLEARYNKSATELFDEFNIITEEINKLITQRQSQDSELKQKNQNIETSKTQLKELNQKIHINAAAHEALQKIGPKKIAQVAKFISQCEAMDYDSKKISQLLRWREKLQKQKTRALISK